MDCGKWLKMGLLQGRFGAWVGGEGYRRVSSAVQKLATSSPPEKEKAALGGLVSFDLMGRIFSLPPIIRIPSPALKSAKYL